MNREEFLTTDLPDPDAALRFLGQLAENHPAQAAKLSKNEGLLSDVLTLVAFSPLLATTVLQNPEYLWWLNRKRGESGIRSKDELLESLARFALTNSQLDPQVLFTRFRRRELLRIYLRDIRRLATIAEITEEISNLADAILQSALQLARHEMDNRFGKPQEIGQNGRTIPARFCIAALGKLGSRELNYSSDIDLLFLYSNEGTTSGGSRGAVTNREYFVKLAEYTTKLVGQQTGEGAAYRVDLRLRPHGTLGALTLSVQDTVRYFKTEARAWERQILIRSRGCAGDIEIFREFFAQVEDLVFSADENIKSSLENVRRSKQQIDLEQINRRGYNVKLGPGGIREIEFLAQALQLAYGGRDPWLRSPHTLISLSRLADRKHLSESELTKLSAAYTFLRRTEHVLQMENGVQTHIVPDDPDKRALLALRMNFAVGGDFERDLAAHTSNVSRVFFRIFGGLSDPTSSISKEISAPATRSNLMASIEKSDIAFDSSSSNIAVLKRLAEVSPHFSAKLASNPHLAANLPDPSTPFPKRDYHALLIAEVGSAGDFRSRLSILRRSWSRLLLEVAVYDVFEKISMEAAKRLQTDLAEASIAVAIEIVRLELASKFASQIINLPLTILALGKLGGRGLDYDSDLDVIFVYDDKLPVPGDISHTEFYSRAVELFVTTLSSMTRDGHLYRVDLRLRPYGSKGLSAMSSTAFLAYMRETAAVWEMLAFVKLRAVGGDKVLGKDIESETRRIIHKRAASIDPDELRSETSRIRLALEKQRSLKHRGSEIDIKYGEGGMLDIYFAMRYLQLRDNIPDSGENRSTIFMLECLVSNHSLTTEIYTELLAGYLFLSDLDHNLRLTIGRTTRFPLGNEAALKIIANRKGLTSPAELLEKLNLHRLAIRTAFEKILG
ncbi:MAG: hypothetical protein ACKVQJ_10805 [Pyrinomonadaceae bacterium]